MLNCSEYSKEITKRTSVHLTNSHWHGRSMGTACAIPAILNNWSKTMVQIDLHQTKGTLYICVQSNKKHGIYWAESNRGHIIDVFQFNELKSNQIKSNWGNIIHLSSIKSSSGSVAGLRFGPSVCSTQFQRGQIQYFKGEYKSVNLNICSLTLESGAFDAKRLCDFLIKLNLLKTKSKKEANSIL